MSRTVLACVAHADDEALGCGGTLAAHAAAGDDVHCLIFADGVTSRGSIPAGALAGRDDAASRAAEALGIRPPVRLGFADQRLDGECLLDITQALERLARDIGPTIVYTHHPDDLNRDHQLVSQAVLTAFRPTPGQSVRAVYGFETLSSTEWAFHRPSFHPSRFVDISDTLERKLAAIDAYALEMRPFPHARSREAVEAQARSRGVQVGWAAAEAFSVLRQLDRI